ncbi:MAG: hypothetical protein IJX34_02470 [Clostridia bacterium]|nr:hypothetical protein [Clostridia bacterium]
MIDRIEKLANGETTISNKTNKFNFLYEELVQLKNKLEVSSENNELDDMYRNMYYTKFHDLETLFTEIEEDNLVYFFGTLNEVVTTLKIKLDNVGI